MKFCGFIIEPGSIINRGIFSYEKTVLKVKRREKRKIEEQ